MSTSLDVSIVGAGMGGLTLAGLLADQGVSATVYDQAPSPGEVGAGIQLPPNATSVLARLGVLDDVRAFGFQPRAVETRRWSDDSLLGVTDLGEDCTARFDAPYLTIARTHLHRILLGRVDPASLRWGHRCDLVRADGESATLTFEAGAAWGVSDLVVGADGIRSVVRASVLPEDRPRFTGRVAHRGLLSRDATTTPLDCVTIWLGPGAHFVAYPIDERTISVAAPVSAQHGDESWRSEPDRPALRAAYRGWNPRVQELVDAADSLTVWGLYDRPRPPSLVHARVALIGDAAHPMLPFGAQGAAQAMEDAASLALHLGSVLDGAHLDQALAAYESERLPRLHDVFEYIQGNMRDHHLIDGDQQAERDRMLHRRTDVGELAWLFGHEVGHATSGGA